MKTLMNVVNALEAAAKDAHACKYIDDDAMDILASKCDPATILALTQALRLAVEALEGISDVTNAIETSVDGRKSSYGDWELRLIARKTLASISAAVGGKGGTE